MMSLYTEAFHGKKIQGGDHLIQEDRQDGKWLEQRWLQRAFNDDRDGRCVTKIAK